MEAANRVAWDVGTESVGLCLDLPREQPNRFLTRRVDFHHFYARKVMLVRYASAFVASPGGFGTLDELFETLTLIQTEKTDRRPVILVGQSFWHGLRGWLEEAALPRQSIGAADLDLLCLVDTPQEVVEALADRRSLPAAA